MILIVPLVAPLYHVVVEYYSGLTPWVAVGSIVVSVVVMATNHWRISFAKN